MTRVLVTGAAGRMGGHVLRAVAAHPSLEVGAALEFPGHADLGKEIAPGVALAADLEAAVAACEVAIDFSLPDATLALARAAAPAGLPLVIGTTGFDASGERVLAETAREVAVLRAANFSLGVNLLIELVAEAARRLPDYDLEVIELHHARKVDAPSGTALRLAEAAADARGVRLADVATYHREGLTGPRETGTIGLQTLRAGDAVGEHTVYLAGAGERLELSHRALSRENFASGAARAAAWLVGHPPALYSMQDVLRAA